MDSVEEIEKRLRSEMKNQMAKLLKQVGCSGGAGSSAAAMLRDSDPLSTNTSKLVQSLRDLSFPLLNPTTVLLI